MLHTCNPSTPEIKQEGPHKFEASLGYTQRLHLNILICKDQGTKQNVSAIKLAQNT